MDTTKIAETFPAIEITERHSDFYSGEILFGAEIENIVKSIDKKQKEDRKFRKRFFPEIDFILNRAESEISISEYIKSGHVFALAVWNAVEKLRFKIEKIETDSSFFWTLKIRFFKNFAKVNSKYNLKFFYNPEWYYKLMADLDREDKVIQENPSLPLDGENDETYQSDEEKFKIILQKRNNAKMRFDSEMEICGDIFFDAHTQKSEYSLVKGDGAISTIVYFNIPKNIVNILNNVGEMVSSFNVKTDPLIDEDTGEIL